MMLIYLILGIYWRYAMNNIKINKNDLINFLEYLLEHVEECYYKECKQSIKRFLERNGIKYE